MRNYLLLIPFLLLFPGIRPVTAQDLGEDYEEILVYLKVQGVGAYEINSIFSYNDNRLLLPVTDLFTTLRINQETSERYDSVSGYLLNENKPYLINYPERYIAINGDTLRLKENDVLKTNFGLFLHTGVFGRAFGLYCNFSFRALSVDLKTDLELPAIRDLRLAQMRKNIEMIKGEVEVDTTYDRKYHWLKFGMMDWAVNLTQTDGDLTNNRLSTAIGAEVLGGETNVILNYSSNQDFQLNNQQFTWRWANNKSKYVRQVIAGKLSPGSIASVYDPFYGVIVTNSPTSYRRSFGEYELTGYTEPGWTVELYVNNVMVDYKKADASGFYSFMVPLIYGSSEVVVKLYGPYGEERTREQPISIPYNFLPQGELEYTIRGGMVDDTLRSSFARAEVNYGVNRFMTLGGGYENYAYLPKDGSIPFLRASFSPTGNLLITGEYADKVRANALMSYRLKNSASIEVEYARYEPGQEAIRFNYLEERRINVSVPLNLGFFKGYTRMGFKQNVYENFNYNTAQFLLTTNIGPVSANLTTNANWTGSSKPFFNSNLSGSMRLPYGMSARSQMQFSIESMEIQSYRIELEKRIARQGYASINYEDNLVSNTRSVNVSFRYDLSFAQSSATARFSNAGVQTTQGLAGSLAFGSGNKYIHKDNRSVTGRGGITIVPFLDINFNNIKDEDEPLVPEIDLLINGGRFLDREDSLTRIMDLEPYTSYLIEMKNDGFDNIAWQLRDKAIRVHIDPNQFKRIEIPVFPMGELSGMIYIRKGRGSVGQGRILINIYNADSTLVKKVMSERDGYYTFLGLPPGNYFAKLDPVQMEKLGWRHEPAYRKFSVQPSQWGDIVEGIDFIINKPPDEKPDVAEVELESPPIDEVLPEPKEIVPDTDNGFRIFPGGIFVQGASCPTKFIAFEVLDSIQKATSYPSGIVFTNGKYKIRFGYFESPDEARLCLNEVREKRIDAFMGIDKFATGSIIYPEKIKKENATDSVAGTTDSTGIMSTNPVDTTNADTGANHDLSRPGSMEDIPTAYHVKEGAYFVQVASSNTLNGAISLLEKYRDINANHIGIVKVDSSYAVRYGYFGTSDEASMCYEELNSVGVKAYWRRIKNIHDGDEDLQEIQMQGKYFVQMASCETAIEAKAIAGKFVSFVNQPILIVKIDGAYKVRFGYFDNPSEARFVFVELKSEGYGPYIGMDDAKFRNVIFPKFD